MENQEKPDRKRTAVLLLCLVLALTGIKGVTAAMHFCTGKLMEQNGRRTGKEPESGTEDAADEEPVSAGKGEMYVFSEQV